MYLFPGADEVHISVLLIMLLYQRVCPDIFSRAHFKVHRLLDQLDVERTNPDIVGATLGLLLESSTKTLRNLLEVSFFHWLGMLRVLPMLVTWAWGCYHLAK